MPYHRVVPVLLYDDGAIYRTQRFARHYRLGDPLQQLERYKAWDIDELIYIDIRRTAGGQRLLGLVPEIVRNCFAPLAVGGGIQSIDDVNRYLEAGADRVVINTAALTKASFIEEAAHRFGQQAIIVSIDAKRDADGRFEVMANCGRERTGILPAVWAAEAAERGAGEIFINSIDRDGMGAGYDLDLIALIRDAVKIPVIACGGVGAYEHFIEGFAAGAHSVAAANLFAFKELSYLEAKDILHAAGISVRPSTIAAKSAEKTSKLTVSNHG